MQRLGIVSLLVAIGGCGSPPMSEPRSPTPPSSVDETRAPPVVVQPAHEAPAKLAPFVEAHNRYRARHCAPPVSWSPKLAAVARQWAQSLRERGCPLEHSRNRYGENLAAATAGALSPEQVTAMWYREVERYDFSSPGFSFEAGHFTQLVWAATREIGCAEVSCNGIELWVCNYAPAGNVHGQFAENVLPTPCRR